MGRFLISLFAVAVAAGCSQSFRDTTAFESSGRQKPCVALVPVVNSAGCADLTWDLSSEFTTEIAKRLYNSHKLYLVAEEKTPSEIAKSISEMPLQNIDLAALDVTTGAQFLIVTELVEQKMTPYGPAANHPDVKYISEAGAILTLSMRVRVIDMRKERPVVVLQEVVDTDYNVTKPYLYVDYKKYPYGSDFFSRTPLGIAHAKLVKEVVSHIESYVGASS